MRNLRGLCILRTQFGLFKRSRVTISNIPLHTAVLRGKPLTRAKSTYIDLFKILVLFEFCDPDIVYGKLDVYKRQALDSK